MEWTKLKDWWFFKKWRKYRRAAENKSVSFYNESFEVCIFFLKIINRFYLKYKFRFLQFSEIYYGINFLFTISKLFI